MVTHPGATPSIGAYQPIDTPRPIKAKEDPAGRPVGIGGLKVIAVEDRWRIDDEWWRNAPVSRLYYAVLLNTGQRLAIYKDLVTGAWYRQSY